eukprot:14656113-Alexandrium_andersonii.AAC.3
MEVCAADHVIRKTKSWVAPGRICEVGFSRQVVSELWFGNVLRCGCPEVSAKGPGRTSSATNQSRLSRTATSCCTGWCCSSGWA